MQTKEKIVILVTFSEVNWGEVSHIGILFGGKPEMIEIVISPCWRCEREAGNAAVGMRCIVVMGSVTRDEVTWM